jgi:hypothetical protein
MCCSNGHCCVCGMDTVLTASCKCTQKGYIMHIIKCLCKKSKMDNERIV